MLKAIARWTTKKSITFCVIILNGKGDINIQSLFDGFSGRGFHIPHEISLHVCPRLSGRCWLFFQHKKLIQFCGKKLVWTPSIGLIKIDHFSKTLLQFWRERSFSSHSWFVRLALNTIGKCLYFRPSTSMWLTLLDSCQNVKIWLTYRKKWRLRGCSTYLYTK